MYITLFGESKDKNVQGILEEYKKRISRYQDLDFKFFKEYKDLDAFLDQVKANDGNKKIYLLSEYGETFDTYEFSNIYEKALTNSLKEIYFCIGPAEGWGLSKNYLKDNFKSDYKNVGLISLSKMTMQHDIASMVLVEQIYRVVSIKNNLPYHKD